MNLLKTQGNSTSPLGIKADIIHYTSRILSVYLRQQHDMTLPPLGSPCKWALTLAAGGDLLKQPLLSDLRPRKSLYIRFSTISSQTLESPEPLWLVCKVSYTNNIICVRERKETQYINEQHIDFPVVLEHLFTE